MVYQSGKANIIADALLRSRPIAAKPEESAHQEQQNDQDAEKQCDQLFTVTSSVRVEESELIHVQRSSTGRFSVDKVTWAARSGVKA